jgi:hypothetical protein
MPEGRLMPTIADQIRARLESPRRHVHGSETVALLAVLDKCQAMREEARRNGLGLGAFLASRRQPEVFLGVMGRVVHDLVLSAISERVGN